jgi:energy-coupling factor transporter ATP-binding protein EcfA2
MMFEEYRLKAQGRLSACREIIRSYQAMAAGASRWIPSVALQSECQTALNILDRLEERLDRKLVVTLIGPSGSGKSTLLNALAQHDGLSAVGINRPTTKEIVAFCQAAADAEFLVAELGNDQVAVRSSAAADALKNVILVDSPDMDSTESRTYRPVLEQYPGSLLYVVLNRCDRLQEVELKQSILPDLQQHLQSAWQKKVDAVFCISARSHLEDPQWPEGEKPLHKFDQYRQLHDEIFGTLNQSSRIVDSRIERAQHLVALIRNSAESAVAGIREKLERIRADILRLELEARTSAVRAMKEAGGEMLTGIHAMLYQKLAGRWWGPVGWLVALWARFLMAGAGVLATLRFGNPLVQLWGLLSSLVRLRKARQAVAEASSGGDLHPILVKYRYTIQQTWPEIAGRMVAAGFNSSVRSLTNMLPDDKELGQRLTSGWKTTLDSVMDRRATALSGFLLQLIFNTPTLALMGLFGYQSVKNFLFQNTLPSGYFLHAGISIVIVWLLSFVLLQIIVRFAGGRSMLDRTFDRLIKDTGAGDTELLSSSLINEIDTILLIEDK